MMITVSYSVCAGEIKTTDIRRTCVNVDIKRKSTFWRVLSESAGLFSMSHTRAPDMLDLL